jgi:hypothetical protein
VLAAAVDWFQSHSRECRGWYEILVDIYHRISAVFFCLVDDFVSSTFNLMSTSFSSSVEPLLLMVESHTTCSLRRPEASTVSNQAPLNAVERGRSQLLLSVEIEPFLYVNSSRWVRFGLAREMSLFSLLCLSRAARTCRRSECAEQIIYITWRNRKNIVKEITKQNLGFIVDDKLPQRVQPTSSEICFRLEYIT